MALKKTAFVNKNNEIVIKHAINKYKNATENVIVFLLNEYEKSNAENKEEIYKHTDEFIEKIKVIDIFLKTKFPSYF